MLIACMNTLALVFGLRQERLTGEAVPVVEPPTDPVQILWRLPDGNFKWFPNGVVPVCPADC